MYNVPYIAADADNWNTREFQANRFQDAVKFKSDGTCLALKKIKVQKITVITKCTGKGRKEEETLMAQSKES